MEYMYNNILFKQSEIIDCLCVCVCVCIIEICEILNEKLVKEYTLLYWNLQIHCIIVDDLSFIFIQMVLTILYVIQTFLIQFLLVFMLCWIFIVLNYRSIFNTVINHFKRIFENYKRIDHVCFGGNMMGFSSKLNKLTTVLSNFSFSTLLPFMLLCLLEKGFTVLLMT